MFLEEFIEIYSVYLSFSLFSTLIFLYSYFLVSYKLHLHFFIPENKTNSLIELEGTVFDVCMKQKIICFHVN